MIVPTSWAVTDLFNFTRPVSRSTSSSPPWPAVGLDDIAQADEFGFAARRRKFSGPVNHLFFGAAEQARRLRIELFLELAAGLKRRGAVDVGRAAATEADVDAVGNVRRVADAAADFLVRHLHLGSNGLAQHGLQSGALVPGDGENGEAAVGFSGQVNPDFPGAGAALVH